MAFLCKVIDAVLFVFFLLISVTAPLIDGQTCLPSHIFPPFLLELKKWYSREYGDYLISEKPHFFVGVVWVELLFQWPLAVASVYGIATGKPWVTTTCLMYGASTLTSMVAILADIKFSGRASDQLLMIYLPFFGVSILALFRGLSAGSTKS
ncbi:hypothetical protein M569_02037, partial [Genlisea aurea]